MKYLFYIAKLYSIPIVKPLITYLSETDHEFGLYLSQKVLNEFPAEWKSGRVFKSIKETEAYEPTFVISPGNFVDFRIPGIKVQIFHGLGVEKKSHFKIRHFFDVYLTSGPYVTDRFSRMQVTHKYFLVRETGWPKIDYILDYPTKNIKKRFSMPPDKRVILYAPTFSERMHSASELLPVILDGVRDDEIWLMKFHEFMDKQIVETIRRQTSPSIRMIDDYDVTPYLHLSDVIVSDTSSVVYEFMALNKPVITFRTAGRPDKGIDIRDPADLREALERSFTCPLEFEAKRREHLNQINPYLDGQISRRVFETLDMVRGELPKGRKPLNLKRKAQILYHATFKKGYLK